MAGAEASADLGDEDGKKNAKAAIDVMPEM